MNEAQSFAEQLDRCPLVIIYRGLNANDCLEITQALSEVGVRCFEVTLNTPNAIQSIKQLRERMGPEISIGAGTVLNCEQVQQVADAGAGFIISPNVNESVIRATKAAGILSIPGAFTPTEIVNAWDYGADIVKIFPVNVVGSEYIRQLRGPLQDIPFMGTGGVGFELVEDLFRAGISSIGLSAHLLGQELVEKRDWKALARNAQKFHEAARNAMSKVKV